MRGSVLAGWSDKELNNLLDAALHELLLILYL